MSSPIWTPDALASEAGRYAGSGWRFVEAQHQVSTLKLVDTLEEQRILEGLIETTKPVVPADCRHLDYLLAAPFRYGASLPRGSRFRRAGRTRGVFYASEQCETAVAEIAFYRLLFFAESPRTPWPREAVEYTALTVALATDRSVDLTVQPFVGYRATWIDPVDYEPCQELADAARGRATRAHTIRVRTRSAQPRQSGCPRLRGVLPITPPRPPNLAHSNRTDRRAGDLRVPEIRYGVPAGSVHRPQTGFARME